MIVVSGILILMGADILAGVCYALYTHVARKLAVRPSEPPWWQHMAWWAEGCLLGWERGIQGGENIW